jgi:hypothetical protein
VRKPKSKRTTRLAAAVILPGALTGGGCAFGPYTLERSHGRYNEAIRRVEEEQLLRNLVHVRYNEIPLNLNVSSIAAQYELAGGAEARPFFIAPNPSNSNVIFRTFTSILPDVTVSGASRPTVSLIPSDNGEAVRKFLTPIRPEQRLVVVGGPVPASALTAAVIEAAAKSGLEYRPRADGTTWDLVRKEQLLVLELNPAAVDDPIARELAGLLNLEPGRPRYEIVVNPGIVPDPLQVPRPPSDELQISLRSTSQVYFYLANGVEVPREHLEAGLVRLPMGPDGLLFDGRAVTEGLFTVHACRGHKPPPTAFVALKHRDYWYYIDDRDQESKATFALVLSLSRLDFARQLTGGPFLTLPVGR